LKQKYSDRVDTAAKDSNLHFLFALCKPWI